MSVSGVLKVEKCYRYSGINGNKTHFHKTEPIYSDVTCNSGMNY